MIQIIRNAFFRILLLGVFILGFLGFLLFTTPGVYSAVQMASLFIPGTLKAKGLQGRLLDHFTAEELKYSNKTTSIKLNQISVNWDFISLISHHLASKYHLKAGSLVLTSGGVINTFNKLELIGAIEDTNHGTFTLTSAPGQYRIPANTYLPFLDFKDGMVTGLLTPQGLSGKGKALLNQQAECNLQFKLPGFTLNHGLSSNQALSAEMTLLLNSLDFIHQSVPELGTLKGQIKASLKATGTVKNTHISSLLSLSKASFDLPNLGLKLDNISIDITGKDHQWLAVGSLNSGTNKLLLRGKGPFTQELSGSLNVDGMDFPVMNTREYQINLSPHLSLAFAKSGLSITGTILVPYAKIKPLSFTNSITLSEDVVFANQPQSAQANPFNTRMTINVEMGKDVELTFKGLHATLAGKATLSQQPQGPITANGELTVKKGQYKAYGQNLEIDQGQLLFTGGTLDNPGINLRASKKITNSLGNLSGSNQMLDLNSAIGTNLKVGVEVTGRLTAPKIQLFSNPALLNQADILSMLVLGRPASQANKAGGQLLLAAISSMNLGTGTNGAQLIEQLKETVGLDLNVQTNTNYNQATHQFTDSTAVVVGKPLSKNLYLSYNVGLSQSDPNVLTLRYLLNKFWSIQVSSSLIGSGIDFLYNRSKEK